jgi:hypothetical protein
MASTAIRIIPDSHAAKRQKRRSAQKLCALNSFFTTGWTTGIISARGADMMRAASDAAVRAVGQGGQFSFPVRSALVLILM